MRKKAICFLLAAILCVGMAGCGKEKDDSGAQSGGGDKGESSGQSGESTGASTGALDTVYWGFQGQTYDSSTKNWPTDIYKEFQEAIAEYAGVNIEFQGWPDNQALELALAGGTMPDMINTNRDYVTALLTGGHVQAMDEYLDNAPNMLDVSKVRVEAMRKYYSKNNDGKLYFITPYVGQEPIDKTWWNGLTIRWDYYKELGYPEVKTEDDFLEVVRQAVEKHPQTEDGKKVYGIATFSDGTLWGWWIRGCMYGYHNITDSYSLDILNDNTIINNFTELNSPVWRDIRFYYKANQMGLFDPDSLTMKGDDLNAKATNGQLVATNCAWYGGNLYGVESESDPNTLAQYMVLPVEGQVNWNGASSQIGWSFFTGMSAKTKYPEAVMKILDYVNTPEGVRLGYMGKQGERWDIVNGEPKVTEEAIELQSKGGDAFAVYANGVWNGAMGLSATTVCPDGGKVNLWLDPDIWKRNLTPAEKDFSEHYGVEVPSDAANELIKAGKAYNKSIQNQDLLTLLPPLTQDITRIDSRCLDIMNKAIPRLVLAKDQAEFDVVQQETLQALEDADIQTSIKWWKEQETSIKEFLDSVQ